VPVASPSLSQSRALNGQKVDNQIPVVFRMLGSVEAYQAERRVELGPPQTQRLLVALLADVDRPVPRHALSEWIQDGETKNPDQDLSARMADLRKRLGAVGLDGALVSRNKAVRLDIPAESVDVHRFERLVEQARGAGDQQAADLLGEALELVRGQPLGGLVGPRIETYRTFLRTKISNARIEHARLMLRLGRSSDAIPALVDLHGAEPHQEKVVALLMLAHYRSGDQATALAKYREFKKDLVEAEGIDVSDALSELHNRILQRDSSLDAMSEIDEPIGESMSNGGASENKPTSFRTGDKIASGTESLATEYAILGTPGPAGGEFTSPEQLRAADHVVTGKKTASGHRAVAAEYAIDQRTPR
jgi:DNA-binding SARP family transcriptional activator